MAAEAHPPRDDTWHGIAQSSLFSATRRNDRAVLKEAPSRRSVCLITERRSRVIDRRGHQASIEHAKQRATFGMHECALTNHHEPPRSASTAHIQGDRYRAPWPRLTAAIRALSADQAYSLRVIRFQAALLRYRRLFAAAVGLPQRDTCTRMPQFCAILRSNGRSHR